VLLILEVLQLRLGLLVDIQHLPLLLMDLGQVLVWVILRLPIVKGV
jgi:hypothetical protein